MLIPQQCTECHRSFEAERRRGVCGNPACARSRARKMVFRPIDLDNATGWYRPLLMALSKEEGEIRDEIWVDFAVARTLAAERGLSHHQLQDLRRHGIIEGRPLPPRIAGRKRFAYPLKKIYLACRIHNEWYGRGGIGRRRVV